MKLFIEIIDPSNIRPCFQAVEYVAGLEGLSLRSPREFSLPEIDDLLVNVRENKQELALNCSRIFHEDDIPYLKDMLKEMKKRDISHIFYSDLGVYMLAKECGMEDRLIYNASTYLTNTEDVNLYASLGASTVVSADLSLEEQLAIVEGSRKPVLIYAFGKYSIFHSKRELLTNYLKYRKNDKVTPRDNKSLTLIEEFRKEYYPIVEDANGTHVYIPKFYCLLKELPLFKPENLWGLYLSTNFLNSEQINILLDIYNEARMRPENGAAMYSELEKVIPDLGEGIRNQKTMLTKAGDAE